jgi:DinB superfamily
MGAKTESLAKQFEAKARETAAVIEKLSDADWQKVTTGEKWTVGVTAHHLAGAFEPVAGIVSAIAAGQARGGFTRALLDQMNAQHAKECASCTKAETLALLEQTTSKAAAVVRGLSDEQLQTSGIVFTDAPPMTVEQMIMGGLILHIDEHLGSIRQTVGR